MKKKPRISRRSQVNDLVDMAKVVCQVIPGSTCRVQRKGAVTELKINIAGQEETIIPINARSRDGFAKGKRRVLMAIGLR